MRNRRLRDQVPERSPMDAGRREFFADRMTIAEYEAVVANLLAGGECCPACGRFPVDGYGLCSLHTV